MTGVLVWCAAWLVGMVLPLALVVLGVQAGKHPQRWERLESYGPWFIEVWHWSAYRRTIQLTREQWRRRAEARQGIR